MVRTLAVRSACGAVALCALLPSVAGFQSSSAEVSTISQPRKNRLPSNPDLPEPNIRVDSTLVLIPAHVTTPEGAPVTGLTKDNFQLREDGVIQNLTYFARDEAALSVGLLFDASGSMQNKMRRSSEAVANFFKTANAQDEFFLIEFNERPKLTVPFTHSPEEIYKRVAHSRAFGRTSLLDAIDTALRQMRYARNPRKALVILSDGGDNRSRRTASEIKSAILESDVQIFAMGIFDSADEGRRRPPEEQNGPRLLDEIAEQTGGRSYRIDTVDDLPAVSTRISEELRTEYLLGYSPTNAARDGKYRSVQLSVIPTRTPKLNLAYRHGYRAPAD